MGVTLTSPRPAHGALNWDTTLEADLAALAGGINAATLFGPANLNSYFTQSGAYRGGNLTNAPGGSTASHMVLVNYQDATLQTQFAFNMLTGSLWFRTQSGSVWSAWRQVVDSSSDTGWVTASTGITAATGWTLANLKYRVNNGVATIGLTATRSGGTVAFSAAGIVASQQVAALPAALTPSTTNGVIASTGQGSTLQASGHVAASGALNITNGAPGQSIVTGTVLDLYGTYSL